MLEFLFFPSFQPHLNAERKSVIVSNLSEKMLHINWYLTSMRGPFELLGNENQECAPWKGSIAHHFISKNCLRVV